MTGPGSSVGSESSAGDLPVIDSVFSGELVPVDDEEGFPKVFFVEGGGLPGAVLRFSSLNPGESVNEAINRFHRATSHFEVLRSFGIEIIETDTDNYGLVAKGEHPTDPGEGEGIYYTVPFARLIPLQEGSASLEDELFHPLFDYFEWAVSGQSEVLADLVVPSTVLELQLVQFSLLEDDTLILHDIEPEMFSLETIGGLRSFWRLLYSISRRCEALGTARR